MRIVCISDTHGQHEGLSVPDGDVLVHAGDFTLDSCGELSSARFNHWLGDLPHKRKVVIAGNHDFIFERRPDWAPGLLTNATYLCDSGCEIGGLKFWGSPITPRFMDWAFMRDRGADIRKHWDLIPDDTDVLITHGPPSHVLDTSYRGGDHLGCTDLMESVEYIQPQLHVFGHIHGGRGLRHITDTTYVNAACLDEAYRPVPDPVFVVDLD